MANPFVQGLLDRLLARAARLSSEAEDPARPRRTTRKGSLEDSETAAAARAREAWSRGDVAKAVEEIELFADYSSRPETLVLHGEMLMAAGNSERAKQVLERGLRTTPGHPGLLEALANLHEHLGNGTEEFRLRLRRLKAGSRYEPHHVVEAISAMLRGASPDRPMIKGDLALICKLFDQVEPLATVAQRLAFAELIFTIKRTRDRAIELAQANAAPLAGTQLRALAYVAPEAISLRHELPDDELPGTQLRMLELTDASVLPGVHWSPTLHSGQQVLQGFVNSPWVTARMQPDSQLIMQNIDELLVRMPEGTPRRIEDTVVLVGNHPDFYRFVVDHLSRLVALHTLGRTPTDALWAVADEAPAYQLEYLQLLGIPADKLLRVSAYEPIEFRHLVAPLPMARGGRLVSPLIARWLRETVARRLGLSNEPPTLRVYLSSSRADARRISNESELIPWLESQGFVCVHMADLDAAAQVRLLSQTRELIAPAGGAMGCMAFMPPGGRVTALYNAYLPLSVEGIDYDYMARACRLAFTVAGGLPEPRSLDPGSDFAVPLEALQQAMLAEAVVAPPT